MNSGTAIFKLHENIIIIMTIIDYYDYFYNYINCNYDYDYDYHHY